MDTIIALQQKWNALASQHSNNETIIQQAFNYLVSQYTQKGRHYHNLQHIYALLRLEEQYRPAIRRPDIVQWAILFHDIIYNVLKSDNEEKSAEAAAGFLEQINYPARDKDLVMAYIRATKSHVGNNEDTDLDLFLDFDMSILGSPEDAYKQYTQQIRQEYSVYPDVLYKPGRRKVLTHFLESPIFRTAGFKDLYEVQARANIRAEIAEL